jgi:membrane protein YqaA with SNARE-associated domain
VETLSETDFSIRSILIRTLLVTGVLLVVVVALGVFFRGPLETFAHSIVSTMGLGGIFLGVFLGDAFTFPIPPDTYLLLAVASQLSPAPVLAVCCVASLTAGSLSYRIGPLLLGVPWLGTKINNFRPQGEQLFELYGSRAVCIAALTPIPFSLVCWSAGIFRMPYRGFFLATLWRIPRFLGYYALFVLGWSPL